MASSTIIVSTTTLPGSSADDGSCGQNSAQGERSGVDYQASRDSSSLVTSVESVRLEQSEARQPSHNISISRVNSEQVLTHGLQSEIPGNISVTDRSFDENFPNPENCREPVGLDTDFVPKPVAFIGSLSSAQTTYSFISPTANQGPVTLTTGLGEPMDFEYPISDSFTEIDGAYGNVLGGEYLQSDLSMPSYVPPLDFPKPVVIQPDYDEVPYEEERYEMDSEESSDNDVAITGQQNTNTSTMPESRTRESVGYSIVINVKTKKNASTLESLAKTSNHGVQNSTEGSRGRISSIVPRSPSDSTSTKPECSSITRSEPNTISSTAPSSTAQTTTSNGGNSQLLRQALFGPDETGHKTLTSLHASEIQERRRRPKSSKTYNSTSALLPLPLQPVSTSDLPPMPLQTIRSSGTDETSERILPPIGETSTQETQESQIIRSELLNGSNCTATETPSTLQPTENANSDLLQCVTFAYEISGHLHAPGILLPPLGEQVDQPTSVDNAVCEVKTRRPSKYPNDKATDMSYILMTGPNYTVTPLYISAQTLCRSSERAAPRVDKDSSDNDEDKEDKNPQIEGYRGAGSLTKRSDNNTLEEEKEDVTEPRTELAVVERNVDDIKTQNSTEFIDEKPDLSKLGVVIEINKENNDLDSTSDIATHLDTNNTDKEESDSNEPLEMEIEQNPGSAVDDNLGPDGNEGPENSETDTASTVEHTKTNSHGENDGVVVKQETVETDNVQNRGIDESVIDLTTASPVDDTIISQSYDFGCYLCDFESNTDKDIARHWMKVHVPKKPYLCSYCLAEFSSSYKTRWHIEKFHPGLDINISLKRSELYDNPLIFELESHAGPESTINAKSNKVVSVNHDNADRPQEENKTDDYFFCCKKCSFKCSEPYSLKIHLKKQHQISRPFTCVYCRSQFTCNFDLRRHQATWHPQENPVSYCKDVQYGDKSGNSDKSPSPTPENFGSIFRCSRCDTVNDVSELRKRLGFMVCKTCGFNSNFSSLHKNKVLVCKICDYKTQDRSAMSRHLKYNHTNCRPYQCAFCPYSAVEKPKVRSHIMAHHKNKPICVIKDHTVALNFRSHINSLFSKLTFVADATNDNIELFEGEGQSGQGKTVRQDKTSKNKPDSEHNLRKKRPKILRITATDTDQEEPDPEDADEADVTDMPLERRKTRKKSSAPTTIRLTSYTITSDGELNCQLCRFKTPLWEDMCSHLRENHPGMDDSIPKPKTFSGVHFKCCKCDYRCADRSCMSRHVKYMHLVDRPHLCPYCNYGNVEKTKVKLHIRSNHQNKRERVITDSKMMAYLMEEVKNHYVRIDRCGREEQESRKAPSRNTPVSAYIQSRMALMKKSPDESYRPDTDIISIKSEPEDEDEPSKIDPPITTADGLDRWLYNEVTKEESDDETDNVDYRSDRQTGQDSQNSSDGESDNKEWFSYEYEYLDDNKEPEMSLRGDPKLHYLKPVVVLEDFLCAN